jgi:hypothetical protein
VICFLGAKFHQNAKNKYEKRIFILEILFFLAIFSSHLKENNVFENFKENKKKFEIFSPHLNCAFSLVAVF